MNSASFFKNTLILLVILILFISLSSYIKKKLNQYEVEMMHKNEHGNSLTSYFYGACLDIQNGKDIRLFGMIDMIQNHLNRINKFVNDAFRGYAFVLAKTNSLIALIPT